MGSNRKNVSSAVMPCQNRKEEKRKKSNISVSCKHRECPPKDFLRVFELVADKNLPSLEEINIEWHGDDPSPPPTLSLFEDSKEFLKVSGPPYKFIIDNSSNESVYPEYYRKIGNQGNLELNSKNLKEIFTRSFFRTLTLRSLPGREVQNIRVYNPDTWELTIKFPKLQRIKHSSGTKLEKTVLKDTVSKTKERKDKTYDGTRFEQSIKEVENKGKNKVIIESSSYDDGKGRLDESSRQMQFNTGGYQMLSESSEAETVSEKIEIELSKNGRPVSFGASNAIAWYVRLLYVTQAVSKLLKDIPKYGAYIEYEWGALNGSLKFNWGYTEKKESNSVLFDWAVEFELTFFEIKLEVGIGVSGYSVKFQAFISVEGSISAAFVGRAESEDKGGPAQCNMNGKIEGVGGARVSVREMVEIEPTVTGGYEISFENSFFSSKGIWDGELAFKFTGLIGRVSCSIGNAHANGEERHASKNGFIGKIENISNEKVFIEPRTLGSWKLPGDFRDEETDSKCGDKEIRELLTRMLNGDFCDGRFWNLPKINVRKWLDHGSYNQEGSFVKFVKYGVLNHSPMVDVEESEIVDLIFGKISEQKYFNRNLEDVQLFIESLYAAISHLCVQGGEERFKQLYVEWSDLKKYIDGREFLRIVKSNQDYAAKFKEANSIK